MTNHVDLGLPDSIRKLQVDPNLGIDFETRPVGFPVLIKSMERMISKTFTNQRDLGVTNKIRE